MIIISDLNNFSFETLHINKGDFIIITYDKNKVACEEIQTTFENVRQITKHENPMITIPQGMQLSTYEKNDLIKYLHTLLNMLEDNNE